MFHFSSKEQEKTAKVSKRVNTISEVSENVKQMDELLENYKRQELAKSDHETLQVNNSIYCMGGSFGWLCLGGLRTTGFKGQQAAPRFFKGKRVTTAGIASSIPDERCPSCLRMEIGMELALMCHFEFLCKLSALLVVSYREMVLPLIVE